MPLDSLTDVSDDALMVLYANGDAQAAQSLAFRHVPRVLALASRLLRDVAEAEDVTQEALLRLWKIAPNWRQGEAQVSTWLYRVTSNLCTDRLRKKTPEPLPDDYEYADDVAGIDDTLIAQDRTKALQEAMTKLPERQRIAVALRHLEDLDNPDIADVLECSIEAVESLIARGKRNLTKLLVSQQDTLGLKE